MQSLVGWLGLGPDPASSCLGHYGSGAKNSSLFLDSYIPSGNTGTYTVLPTALTGLQWPRIRSPSPDLRVT